MITTAIFPGRYVQGAGAIPELLGEELPRLGSRALVLQDPVVYQKQGSQISLALEGCVEFCVEVFNSECSDEEIGRISALAESYRAEVIVGIGGGKTLDTAKATGAALNKPIAIIPALASTDAPCSSLVVI